MSLYSASRAADPLSGDILAHAADWFLRVRGAGVESDDYAQWLAWIETDPRHRMAFSEIQEAWNVAGELPSASWPQPKDLSYRAPHAPSSRIFSQRTPLAIAASLVVVALGFLAVREYGFGAKEHITTRRGEQQSTLLPDGSRIELGGQTGVALHFTEEQRLVVADEGEAFYQVAHDPKRPFVVQAGPVNVTALGTAFSIRREGDVVSVVVTEGSVEVGENTSWSRMNDLKKAHLKKGLAVRAKAGQRVRFDAGKLSTVAEPLKTEGASAWRRGRLRFEDEPLSVVVASLNRYSRREIRLADESLGKLRFTGTVFETQVEDWLNGVQVVFPVEVREVGEERVEIVRR